MKSYFIRLLNYDHVASSKISHLILQSGQTGKPLQLMAHMLAAQQIWLKRCKGLPAPGGPLWPAWAASELGAIIDENHTEWISYLETLQPPDFDAVVTYQNLKGITYHDKLSDILAHLINHGTHHRAQAGVYLKLAGADLPVTDYIFYARDLNQTPSS
ncbi:DinB family protein [Mucilaginibacter sp. AK015]|uniref:DinB family protein n=1 Tax=Mucilaginibacter sp. AK015 TaxID=2723072 RepID=UPI001614A0A6|nr:DinB family protein [Mucilaginibacter sp. AK015]MBB5394396.1 putative damage-inducible protein DinB [Mucilaginibacter sp. AK015]